MPEFNLDSRGTVDNIEFEDLDEFTQGYIEAMFFTNQSYYDSEEFWTDEVQDRIREGRAGGDFPSDHGFMDLAPEALQSIKADCAKFQRDAAAPLGLAYSQAMVDYDREQAGRDFWYTRGGHGVGFWDRDLGEVGERLSDLAQSMGEAWVYLGDDRKIYH